MTKSEFVDLETMAKAMGVSEATARARTLDGVVHAYIFLPNVSAVGSQSEFLPPWSANSFPDIRWADHGSAYSDNGRYYSSVHVGGRHYQGEDVAHSEPTYTLNGWAVLDPYAVGKVLTKDRPLNTDGQWVWILGEDGSKTPLLIRGETVWIERGEDSYNEIQGPMISRADLFFKLPPIPEVPTVLDGRRERSLLRIIRALDVMAKLPDRGAAPAVERQLQELGFDGPNDETIRKVLVEARCLKTSTKG